MVEVMVVVILVGILSAFAIPKFRAITGENQLDGDFNTIAGDLAWARANAMKVGNPVRAVFSTVTHEGTPRLKLTISSVDPTSGALTELRSTIAGPSVALGLPTGVSAPSSSAVPAVAGLGSVSSGYQGPAASEAATTCRNTSASTPGWSDGIQVCGTVLGDVETGAVYLKTTRSSNRTYGILFDRTKSLNFVKLRYMGGRWEKL